MYLGRIAAVKKGFEAISVKDDFGEPRERRRQREGGGRRQCFKVRERDIADFVLVHFGSGRKAPKGETEWTEWGEREGILSRIPRRLGWMEGRQS